MSMMHVIREKLGPGLLYAGIAVGVSHLVQATSGGAMYGLVMMGYLAFVCLVKYPTFLFASRYTAETGRTLIEGYEAKGRWIVMLYFALQCFEYTFAIAAVSITTVGLVKSILGITMGDIPLALLLIFACLGMLALGRYPLLEDITKGLVIGFTVVTVIVTGVAVAVIDTTGANMSAAIDLRDTPTILFLVAAAGWMPTGTAGSVGLSLWVKAKEARLGRRVTAAEATFDFNVGYGTSIFTGMCFVTLGTYVLHIDQVVLQTSGAGFANQFMGIFTAIVGGWIYPFIAFAALTVMGTTLLTLVDLLPRTSAEIIMRLSPALRSNDNQLYIGFIVVELVLVSAVLLTLMESFSAFINLMTSMGFVVAPIISALNHWVIFTEVPKAQQPGAVLKAWSWFTIVALTLVSLLYLYLTFSG